MVCREFDLPTFYFVADSGSGSYLDGWRGVRYTEDFSAGRCGLWAALTPRRIRPLVNWLWPGGRAMA